MINVAVNAYVLSRGISGSATALRHVLRALREDPNLTVCELPGPERRGTRIGRLASMMWWDLRGVHRAIHGPAVLLSGCNVGVASSAHPNVLLMHDTMVFDHMSAFDPAFVAYAKALFGISARRSTVVVTGSENAAVRITERFRLSRAPEVVPWPIVGRLGLVSDNDIVDRLARPVVTVVGATERYKCHEVAVRAVALVRQATGLPIELCIVGRPGRADADLDRVIAASDPQRTWIRRVHWLSDEELLAQYRGSWLLLQTSVDEGFGLPVLEASGQGVPVLHSGRGALCEVHPEGSVESRAPGAFATRALRLLDPEMYRKACDESLSSARRHDWTKFQLSWREIVARAATGG